jgi:hypothetical protein
LLTAASVYAASGIAVKTDSGDDVVGAWYKTRSAHCALRTARRGGLRQQNMPYDNILQNLLPLNIGFVAPIVGFGISAISILAVVNYLCEV